MPADNKLELVIEVHADKANAQIKGVNQSLAGFEHIAVNVAKNASSGIDGMTASMVKGSLAGNLLAEAIRGAAECVKEYVVLTDIVNTAKQAYGGNIDVAIRPKDVVDKIQLYALATGQTPKGMPGSRGAGSAVTLAERGGSLYQIPNYSNGSPSSSPPSSGGTAFASAGGLLSSMGSTESAQAWLRTPDHW